MNGNLLPPYWLFGLAVCGICAYFATGVADDKRRPPVEGFLLGVLLGPLGLLIEHLLPQRRW